MQFKMAARILLGILHILLVQGGSLVLLPLGYGHTREREISTAYDWFRPTSWLEVAMGTSRSQVHVMHTSGLVRLEVEEDGWVLMLRKDDSVWRLLQPADSIQYRFEGLRKEVWVSTVLGYEGDLVFQFALPRQASWIRSLYLAYRHKPQRLLSKLGSLARQEGNFILSQIVSF